MDNCNTASELLIKKVCAFTKLSLILTKKYLIFFHIHIHIRFAYVCSKIILNYITHIIYI